MASMQQQIAEAARRSPALAAGAVLVAVALVVGTLVHFGADANGVAWAVVQVGFVFIAWFDLLTRRIPNLVVLPAAVAAIVLRVAFDRGALLECLLAGAIAFAVFLVFALLVRGGLGMGDVKLAGLIGLLLGSDALYALMLGVIVGGLAAAALLAARRGRKSTYAYGPYLALGASLLVLLAAVPRLL